MNQDSPQKPAAAPTEPSGGANRPCPSAPDTASPVGDGPEIRPYSGPDSRRNRGRNNGPNYGPNYGPYFGMFGLTNDTLDRLLSLNEAPLLRAFRHGVMLVMPLLMGAAIAILVNNYPLPAYQEFMASVFGPNWKHPGAVLYNSTIEILALATTVTLSDCLLVRHNNKRPGEAVLPVMGTLTALACLFIMIGPQFGPEGMVLPWGGIRGLFGALIITCASCGLFLRLCRIRKLRLSFYSEGADPILPHMFDTLLPVLFTMLCFVGLREILSAFGIVSLQQAFYHVIQGMFSDAGASLGLGALYAFLVDLCWFFGVHGADLLDPITHNVLLRGMELNSAAINGHQPPPHIFTKYLFEVYIFLGGSGATLGLLAAIFLRSRDFGTRRVAAFSLVPGVFNINELLVFGLPIVLNPAFLLPFVLVPVILLGISYLAITSGLVPLPVYEVDWITPPLINGYLATGSWKGAAMQVFNLGVATLIYIPFVELADRTKILSRRRSFDELVAVAASGSRSPSGKRCTDLPGGVGALARALANDMTKNLRSGNEFLHLSYQPRVNLAENTVPCVEALLRWRHPFYDYIPPELVLALAEDAGLTRELDLLIVEKAFEQQSEWRKNGLVTKVSINLSRDQLEDKQFPALLEQQFSRTGLPPDSMVCEVRESLALHPTGRYHGAIRAIKDTGVHIAIDDFGTGYQALSQLDQLPLTEIQVNRSLITDIADNPQNQNILCDIQEMCFKMGVKTSAEFIESTEQLEMLLELNFSTFQGYHFSEAVTADKCEEFMRNFTTMGNRI